MSILALFINDESEDEFANEEVLVIIRKRKRLRDSTNPLEMDETHFTENFRLPKAAFVDLLRELDEKLKATLRTTAVPNIIKLACLLRFCAQGSYQLSVGNDFQLGLAQPTVSLILKEILSVCEDHICPKWIKFDYNLEEKNIAKLYFYEKSGIPRIIGCGTHIKIKAPEKNVQHLYYNRKGFYSLNIMIVCDHEMKVRYINARYPGATHDSMVWNSSALKSKLEEDFRNGERNTWLLGDAGYPLAPYLITPYRSAQDNSVQSRFNEKHSQARIIIERTIGILKNRFRCLLGERALHYRPLVATRVINVCAALHNICLHYKANFEYSDIGNAGINEESQVLSIATESNSIAENIRNELLSTL